MPFKVRSVMLPEQKYARVWATVLFFIIMFSTAVQAAEPVVHVIPVSGTVDPGMAAYLKRVVSSLEKDDSAILVFAMDTFGGRVDSAFDIVETICTIPRERNHCLCGETRHFRRCLDCPFGRNPDHEEKYPDRGLCTHHPDQ